MKTFAHNEQSENASRTGSGDSRHARYRWYRIALIRLAIGFLVVNLIGVAGVLSNVSGEVGLMELAALLDPLISLALAASILVLGLMVIYYKLVSEDGLEQQMNSIDFTLDYAEHVRAKFESAKTAANKT